MRRRRALAALTAGLLLTAGCATTEDPGTATPTPTDATPGTPPGQDAEVPDTATGRAARWVLDTLAAGDGPTPAEASERFAPAFLDQVPADQLAGVFDQLRADGPYTLTSYAENGPGAQGELTGADGSRLIMSVAVDADERIEGLLFQPAPEIPEIASPADAAAAVGEAAERSAFLLAEVRDGTCTPVESAGANQALPIGSIFKLYVLGAVVAAVDAGDLTWDDTLTLTEELKSLPSGTLHEEPAGTEVSVREAAEAMISVSDNTATDLLIDAVGRERVERALTDLGHRAPALNTPFLTTREMFQLAMSDPALRDAWTEATGEDPLTTALAADDAQRAVVDALPAWDRTVDESLAAQPAWPLGLDWFASTDDLCRAHLALQDLAATDAGAPVREILALNPGVASTDGLGYVGFKGGSAVGEIAGSWYVEDADGAAHVLVVQLADPAGQVPDGGWLSAVADRTLATLSR